MCSSLLFYFHLWVFPQHIQYTMAIYKFILPHRQFCLWLQTQLILNVSSSLLQSITCVCKYKQEEFLDKCVIIRKESLAELRLQVCIHRLWSSKVLKHLFYLRTQAAQLKLMGLFRLKNKHIDWIVVLEPGILTGGSHCICKLSFSQAVSQ